MKGSKNRNKIRNRRAVEHDFEIEAKLQKYLR